MKNKKIIALALGLLILAGLIVVCLKGFNVDFMLKKHDSIEYKIDSDFEISDVKNICSEVFGNKKYKVRIIELFDDSVSINSESITEEEAQELMKKLDDKYKNSKDDEVKSEELGTEISENNEEVTTENGDQIVSDNTEIINEIQNTNYIIISNPKIQLRDLFMPYLIPIILSIIAIGIYVSMRYKKLGSKKVVLNLIGIIAISVLTILSLLAIVRFPINTLVIPIIMLIVLFELAIFCSKYEKELLKNTENE